MIRSACVGAAVWAVACAPAVHETSEAGATAGMVGASAGTGGAPGFALPPSADPSAAAGSGGGAAAPTEPVCAATRAVAQAVPVDLYMLQDQSGSMSVDGKWDAVAAAMSSFVRLPAASGMSVGLAYFPRPPGLVPPECTSCTTPQCLANCGCLSITCGRAGCACAEFSTSSCFTSDYRFPAVAIAELPGAAPVILDSLRAVRPTGGTPTHAALEGAIHYARSWAASRNRRVVIALATDGEPTNCGDSTSGNNTIDSISSLARAAAAEGIFTFVIGVGPQLGNLNAIAAAGGTTRAYLVEGLDVEKPFLTALQSIQGLAARLSCVYAIPPPPAGQVLDPMKVNVEFTTGTPAATTAIGQVAEPGRCGARGGWYYDNPTAPTRIQLCDTTCNTVNSAGTRDVAVTFGCRTNAID